MGNIKRRRLKIDASDYKVGYGNPPRHSQFKPGQRSLSPGRPKGARNFKMVVKATLNEPVKVTRDGKSRKISTLEAILLRLREKALGGDLRALDRMLLLAQAYCEEELAATVGLSANDAEVLRIYTRRVLSGATAKAEPIQDHEEPKRLSGEATDFDKLQTPLKKDIGPSGQKPTTDDSNQDK
jgi:hypothetical protein